MNNSIITLILFAVLIIVLVRDILPIGVVGLGLPFILVTLGLSTTTEVMGAFMSKSAVLMPCVYIIGYSLQVVGISDLIGQKILHKVEKVSKGNEKKAENFVFLVVILGVSITGLVMPKMSVTGALMGVMIAIARSTGISRTKLLLLLAICANIWGNNTLISTPPNMLANGALDSVGAQTLGFLEFALIGIPIAVFGSITMLLLKDKIFPETINEREMAELEVIQENKQNRGEDVPRWKIIATSIVFASFFLLVIFENVTKIPGHISGFLCVAVLLGLKIMPQKQAYASVGWDVYLFCGSMLAFGKVLETSGAGELIASSTLRVLGDDPSPFLVIGVLFSIGAILTQFMSNTGAAGLLFPVTLVFAEKLNADPRALIIAVTMGCGASFMTPMATPSNTMVMGIGDIKFNDYLKVGIPLMIVTAIVCTIGIPLIWPLY
jgi:sodium-dependent dicarboxylate transporter 2/3/5